MPNQATKFVDLVFEGGGVKGIGLIGALAVLEEQGYVAQNLAGTSAGAIVATLRAAGYTPGELHHIMQSLDYTQFEDENWAARLPFGGAVLEVLLDQGVYRGDAFLEFMREKLKAKGVHTFADLVHPEFANDPRYRYRVQVIASDVTEHSLLVLPRDAEKLGIAADDLDVAEAVRMSMSIPFFFEPVRFPNPKTGQRHTIVDGGMLSNYPVWLFDSAGTPEWPTFGLKLVEPQPETPVGERLPPPEPERHGIGAVVDYVRGMAQTMMEFHDRLYIEQANFARTIAVDTLGVRTTEFDLSTERVEALYLSGRAAAQEFLKTWDFDAYIKQFRSGEVHHRRDVVAAEMVAAR